MLLLNNFPKGQMMSTANKQALELAQLQLNNYKKISQEEVAFGDYPDPLHAPGDKNGINRWIAAFGDCA